jgi:hypothetical protein
MATATSSAQGLPARPRRGLPMRCSKCGRENRAGRKFCVHCGAGLELTCPSCGASSEPGERFCGVLTRSANTFEENIITISTITVIRMTTSFCWSTHRAQPFSYRRIAEPRRRKSRYYARTPLRARLPRTHAETCMRHGFPRISSHLADFPTPCLRSLGTR